MTFATVEDARSAALALGRELATGSGQRCSGTHRRGMSRLVSARSAEAFARPNYFDRHQMLLDHEALGRVDHEPLEYAHQHVHHQLLVADSTHVVGKRLVADVHLTAAPAVAFRAVA